MKDLYFPKIMISDDGQIVLFESEGKGVALNCICGEIGVTYSDWIMLNFKDYNESLIINNKILQNN